jgi:hypothetical protein
MYFIQNLDWLLAFQGFPFPLYSPIQQELELPKIETRTSKTQSTNLLLMQVSRIKNATSCK